MDSEMAEESAAARGGAGQLAAVAEEGEGGAAAAGEQQAPVRAPAAAVGSSKTMERVAAAKKFIEDHYKAQMKNLQERKERYWNTNPSTPSEFPDHGWSTSARVRFR
jgi:serine/threonine kinase 38